MAGIKPRKGKYFQDYARIMHNLQNKEYRARKAGFEFTEAPPKKPAKHYAPTKRELDALIRYHESFDKRLRFTDTTTGKTYKGKAARKVARDIRSGKGVGKGGGGGRTPKPLPPKPEPPEPPQVPTPEPPQAPIPEPPVEEPPEEQPQGPGSEPPTEEPPEESPEDLPGIDEIYYQNLMDLLENFSLVTSETEQLALINPKIRDKVLETTERLIAALLPPTEDKYKAVEENYDYLCNLAAKALNYPFAETESAVGLFIVVLSGHGQVTLADTAEFSDIGDSYDINGGDYDDDIIF